MRHRLSAIAVLNIEPIHNHAIEIKTEPSSARNIPSAQSRQGRGTPGCSEGCSMQPGMASISRWVKPRSRQNGNLVEARQSASVGESLAAGLDQGMTSRRANQMAFHCVGERQDVARATNSTPFPHHPRIRPLGRSPGGPDPAPSRRAGRFVWESSHAGRFR